MDYRAVVVAHLLETQGRNCSECSKEFTLEDPPTVDHIVSRRAGGSDLMSNLQLLHGLCNTSKGAGDVDRGRNTMVKALISDQRQQVAEEQVQRFNGDKDAAAYHLGISRRTLWRWLRRRDSQWKKIPNSGTKVPQLEAQQV
jgi:DNA-binding NtrC family response regulator